MRRVIAFFGICGMVLGFVVVKSADEKFAMGDWIGLIVGTVVPVVFFSIGVRHAKEGGRFLDQSLVQWIVCATLSYAVGIGLAVYFSANLRGG
jgi:Na+/H+-dicarboxylate symporter